MIAKIGTSVSSAYSNAYFYFYYWAVSSAR
jgi:hypothetical protein